MPTHKWTNQEIADKIEWEGFEYFLLEYGPPAPEDLEDETLRPLWAELIAGMLDYEEAKRRVMKHVYGN